MARRGFDQASAFALLEHADEAGRVEDNPKAGTSSRPADQPARGRQNSQGGQGKQQHGKGPTPNTAGRPAAAPAQAARAEDYYRAFEHVFRDPSSGVNEIVLRFHKTKIVRIRPNGDMMLTSGGWYTATTVAALNDALHALGMNLAFQAPVSSGMWTVTDDLGNKYPFKDSMVIKASKPEHSQRGGRLLSAYNGGADVPRYARKPPPGAAAAAGRPAQTAAAGPAGQARPAAAKQPAAAQVHHAGPRPAGAATLENIRAAMQDIFLDEEVADEHLCVICLENARDEVLVPCGHMVLCQACCANVMETTNECPMCREKIEDHCTIDPDDA